MKEIYQQTAEEVLERVESRESGLTDEQVRRSREKCGWNELAEGKKKSILCDKLFAMAIYVLQTPDVNTYKVEFKTLREK